MPRFRYQIFVLDRSFHQRDIDFVPYHQVGDFAGVGTDDVEIDVGIGAVKNAEIFRNHVGSDGRAGADAQRTLGQAAKRSHFFFGLAFGCEQDFCMAHQGQALAGRTDAFWSAVQQAAANLELEVPHALRDRRLAGMEGVRCPGKAAGSNHRREHAEQMEVQWHNFLI